MPDPTLKTVSASQVSALFGRNPYCTKWMLWHHFKGQLSLDIAEDIRMEVGLLMQPVIHELVRRRYQLDVQDNSEDVYFTKGQLGATPDGSFKDPTRGPGIVEAKNVDGLRYKQTWRFDEENRCVGATDYIELQVQQQMLVLGCDWAVIAALVGGNELVMLERYPNEEIQARIILEVADFFDSLEANREPAVEGYESELDCMSELYPTAHQEPVWDLGEEDLEAALELQAILPGLALEGGTRSAADKAYKSVKTKVLAITKDHGNIRLPGGWLKVSKARGTRVTWRPDK